MQSNLATAFPPSDESTVRARRLVLEDADGRATAMLGPALDGHGLVLFDAEERPRAQLVLDLSGAAQLKLHDGGGEVCAWLEVGPGGAPSLWLRALDGESRMLGHAGMQVDPHGCATVSLHDRAGRARALLRVDEGDGRPTLALSDAHGEARVVVSEDQLRHPTTPAPGERPARSVPPLRTEAAPRAPLVEIPAASVSLAPDVAPAEPQTEVDAAAPEPAAEPAPEPQAVAMTAAASEAPGEEGAAIASASVHDALAARVARLEGERPRRRGLATAALVVCAAAVGALAARALGPVAPFLGLGSGDAAVEAREFVLRDASGAVRGRLGSLADGSPYLHLLAPDGAGEIELSALRGPNVQLRLAGGDGSVLLATAPRGGPSLGLWQGGAPVLLAPGNVARFPSSNVTP